MAASRSVLLDRRRSIALLIPVSLILVAYVLYPSIRLFSEGFRLEVLSELFASGSTANLRALKNSVLISLASVLGAGIMGTGLAWAFYRYEFPLRRALMSIAALPLALPPLVGVLAFLFLYGESGMLPRGIQALFELERVPFAFEGRGAVLLVHVYSLYVYFYLFISAALRGLDRSMLEASADLGAGGVRTFWSVVLPSLRPSMVSAALLVFMVSMASFTAPLLFSSTEPFLTVQIYNYKTNGDLALSAGIATILTLICLVFLVMIEWKRKHVSPAPSKGAGTAPLPVQSGWARALALVMGALVLAFLLLPVLTIVLISFVQEGSWTYQILPEQFTFANYTALFAQADVFQPIRNSLIMASVATSANVLFGVAAALLIVKGRIRGRAALRAIAMLPFAIPGTVIAINLILTFNEPTLAGFGRVLVGSFWLLPLAYFVRHIPLVVRATVAALEQYDPRLTEASSDLGAGTGTTFLRVMLPAIGPSILAGTLLTFVAAIGEFVSSILIYTFSNRPISVEILAQLRQYDFGSAAAYSVLLMALIGVATVVVSRLGGNPERVAT